MTLELALRSLDGLSVGDSFGEQGFFHKPDQILAMAQWPWTDDTHMALSVVEVLSRYGEIHQDALATRFAQRYMEDSFRGYAGGAARLLTSIHQGADWRVEAPALFGGGSFGNGAAMRVAPVGAFFADDHERVVEEARKSAVITHAHPEAQAGAIAVAIAASLAANASPPEKTEFLKAVAVAVPESRVRSGIETAMTLKETDSLKVGLTLGAGQQVSAQDTVPFCIWSAAHNLHDFEAAMRNTVKAIGDRDTTCAIVGGIVSLASDIPPEWLAKREPLH